MENSKDETEYIDASFRFLDYLENHSKNLSYQELYDLLALIGNNDYDIPDSLYEVVSECSGEYTIYDDILLDLTSPKLSTLKTFLLSRAILKHAPHLTHGMNLVTQFDSFIETSLLGLNQNESRLLSLLVYNIWNVANITEEYPKHHLTRSLFSKISQLISEVDFTAEWSIEEKQGYYLSHLISETKNLVIEKAVSLDQLNKITRDKQIDALFVDAFLFPSWDEFRTFEKESSFFVVDYNLYSDLLSHLKE